MNNGFNDKGNNDHEYTNSSGPEHSPDDKESIDSAQDNGRKDPPVKEPPKEAPPVKEPPVEEPPAEAPPVKEPPAEEPPLEIPPGEDTPLEMPPAEKPGGEQPPLKVPPREEPGITEVKYRSIAPHGGKEVHYDRRNYTYNIARDTDRTERTGEYTGTGEGTGEGPEGPALDRNAPRYTGYEVRPSEERGPLDNGIDPGRGGNEPPRYGSYDYRAPEKKSRGLLGILGMVLLGAILGTALTLAAMFYFFGRDLLIEDFFDFNGPAQTDTRTTAPASTKTLVTAPAVDTGDTFENRVAAKAIPSVVGITTRVRSEVPSSLFGGQGYGIMQGMGSGVIVSEDGYIVTNAHVVDNGEAWELKIILSDETVVDGEVLWSDAALDLAIVKADAQRLTPMEIGTSESIRVGDKAIAIGNPLGMNLQSTMTSGYISGLDRSIDIQDGGTMDGLIQTDAAINEGNSGGALLNAAGHLIGINTAKAGGSASGIGFAIPVDTAAPIIQKVMEQGSFDSVYMGLTGMNLSTMKAMNNSVTHAGDDGVFITEVMEGTAAFEAGLRRNDIILAIDGQIVTGMTEMKKILLNYELGDTVEISYSRNNSDKTTELTFAQDSSTIKQFIPAPDTQP